MEIKDIEMIHRKMVTALLLCLFSLTVHASNFKVLDMGYTMPSDVPFVRVITNQTDWEIFYNEILTSNGLDPYLDCTWGFLLPPACSFKPPKVNFKSKQVVVIGVGVRYNNVGRLVVSGVDAGWNLENIKVNLLDIDPECTLPHSMIYPMATVVVPKLGKKEVEINIEEATTAVCDFS
jgi:hypothetical protein